MTLVDRPVLACSVCKLFSVGLALDALGPTTLGGRALAAEHLRECFAASLAKAA